MPWYRTGKVAITAGQNTVTGTGTAFSANARVGDAFQGPDGRWYEVTNITSATVLSILPAYQGPTVADGAYGLAPMQGYVKESADRLRQIVNDWGATLAGLGTVSTENVVPVAKGGTGGTTAALARSGLGLKAAAVADIVGTVSQSGGVPTGAIYERGSNANGDYIKFADGTMMCFTSGFPVPAVANGAASEVWTYPANFIAAPCGQITFRTPTSTNSFTSAQLQLTTGLSSATIRLIASVAQTYTMGILIIGRWYA